MKNPRTRWDIRNRDKNRGLQFTCQARKSDDPLPLAPKMNEGIYDFGVLEQTCNNDLTHYGLQRVRFLETRDSWHFILWFVDPPAAPFLKRRCVDFSCSNYEGVYPSVKLWHTRLPIWCAWILQQVHVCLHIFLLSKLPCITDATDPKFGSVSLEHSIIIGTVSFNQTTSRNARYIFG